MTHARLRPELVRLCSALALYSILAPVGRSQLILPYAGIDATATLSSFQLTKTGPTGRAFSIYISSPLNASDALLANTVGLGRAGYFQLNNPSSGNQALRVDSNGTGNSFFALMTGTGRAGTFRIINPASPNVALHTSTTGTGSAFRSEALTGYAGDFSGKVTITDTSLGTPQRPALAAWSNWGNAISAHSMIGTGVVGSGELCGVEGYGPVGVHGYSYDGTGVIATNTEMTGTIPALISNGRFVVYGTKAFQIDHPKDPENRVLTHFCTESPEPTNTYSGKATTDSRGYALIRLPEYFQDINRDFRYQLTCIGQFAAVIVSKEIEGDEFAIQTDKPFVKVSWEVTATRNDRWVQRYGFRTESDKPASKRGLFLRPELYNQPQEKAYNGQLSVRQSGSARKP